MGPRNMLILFFSTLCVSLVLLIILFSFGFKDIDMEFDTKVPEQAPDLSAIYKEEGKPADSRSEEVTSATIRVPSAGGLDSLTGISPTDDVAPELQKDDDKTKADEKAPTPDAAKDDDSEKDKDKKAEKKESKKDVVKDDGPKNPDTLPSAPVPDLKPLVSPEKSPEKEKDSAKKEAAGTGGAYQVYLDGFTSRESAQKSADDLTGRGTPSFVRSTGSGFIVQVGVFSSKENADSAASKAGAKVRKL